MDEIIDLQQLILEQEEELANVLDFWISKTTDDEYGGFYGCINDDGLLIEGSPKGVVQNARILWTFSSAYNFSGNPQYLETANKAYSYIKTHFVDSLHGGLIWEVDYKGETTNRRKQAYAQGFGIYAFSEYYKASGNVGSLNLAKEIYYLVENNFRDNKNGGYIEALNQDWSGLEDFRLSDKDANEPKSMNTHLHILEPYTNLYKVWPNEKLKDSIINLLDIFQNEIINSDTNHFNLFFDLDWTVKSNVISYGHDIEGAWLLREAALAIGDKEILKSIEDTSINLVNITLEEGLDDDGSLFNEKEDSLLDKDKIWWAQAEAMVGLMDAYEINQDDKYLDRINDLWKFIKKHFLDKENGEWFWRVDMNNKVIRGDDKAGFWKCPYHNSRALMEISRRANIILQKESKVLINK